MPSSEAVAVRGAGGATGSAMARNLLNGSRFGGPSGIEELTPGHPVTVRREPRQFPI